MSPSDPAKDLTVDTLGDAEFWTRAHHRMLCKDAQHIARIEARLRVLETPWWRPLERRERRRFADAL